MGGMSARGRMRYVMKLLPTLWKPSKTGPDIVISRAKLSCGHVIRRTRPIRGQARCYEC